MNKIIVIPAAVVVALLVAVAASVPWHHQPEPAIVASAPPASPPLPKPKPEIPEKAARAHKPTPAAATKASPHIDCDQVRWAKQNLSAETLKTLALSHPDQAKAARACG